MDNSVKVVTTFNIPMGNAQKITYPAYLERNRSDAYVRQKRKTNATPLTWQTAQAVEPAADYRVIPEQLMPFLFNIWARLDYVNLVFNNNPFDILIASSEMLFDGECCPR